MNVYDRLLQDHKEISDLLAKIEQPAELQAFGRKQLYEDLRLKLVAHDRAEEACYYPAIEGDQSLHGLVEDGRDEHREISRMLDDLRDDPTDSSDWLDAMRDIRSRFLKHAREEEEEMFPRSRSLLAESQAETLGEEFQKQELRLLIQERQGRAL